jgi:ribonuclease HI
MTLWKELLELVARHADVQWTWVKAHGEIFLDESADMLVTRCVIYG